MQSRVNSLRAYGEMLIESGSIDLAEIGEDLIEFAEQWEAELAAVLKANQTIAKAVKND